MAEPGPEVEPPADQQPGPEKPKETWNQRNPVTKHELLGILKAYDCLPFEADDDVADMIPGLSWKSEATPDEVMWKNIRTKAWSIKEKQENPVYAIVEVCVVRALPALVLSCHTSTAGVRPSRRAPNASPGQYRGLRIRLRR